MCGQVYEQRSAQSVRQISTATPAHLGFLSLLRGTRSPQGKGLTGFGWSPEQKRGRSTMAGDLGSLHRRLDNSLMSDTIGDHDLVGNQAVEFQQQAVCVLLIIKAQGRAQSFDLFLDEAKFLDDGAVGMGFDGIQDCGDGDHRWLPFMA